MIDNRCNHWIYICQARSHLKGARIVRLIEGYNRAICIPDSPPNRLTVIAEITRHNQRQRFHTPYVITYCKEKLTDCRASMKQKLIQMSNAITSWLMDWQTYIIFILMKDRSSKQPCAYYRQCYRTWKEVNKYIANESRSQFLYFSFRKYGFMREFIFNPIWYRKPFDSQPLCHLSINNLLITCKWWRKKNFNIFAHTFSIWNKTPYKYFCHISIGIDSYFTLTHNLKITQHFLKHWNPVS